MTRSTKICHPYLDICLPEPFDGEGQGVDPGLMQLALSKYAYALRELPPPSLLNAPWVPALQLRLPSLPAFANKDAGLARQLHLKPRVVMAETQKPPAVPELRPPAVAELYWQRKNKRQKVFAYVGQFLNSCIDLVNRIVGVVFNGAAALIGALSWVLCSPTFLFGVSAAQLWQSSQQLWRRVLSPLRGAAEALLNAPLVALAITSTFAANIINGRCLSRRGAFECLAQPVVGAFILALSPLLAAVKAMSDSIWEPRSLSVAEKQALSFPDEILNAARIVEQPSFFSRLFMPRGMIGLTVGATVYLRIQDDVKSQGVVGVSKAMKTAYLDVELESEARTLAQKKGATKGAQKEALLRHELVHVLQYRDHGGVVGFLSAYYAQLFANRIFS